MQYHAPQQPAARPRPTKDYAPKKRRNRALSIVPLLLLFLALLVIMYLIFPKEAGRHIGTSKYTGLVFSEAMSANATAVPDENGEFYDWLEIYNGSGEDIDMDGVMLTNRSDRITFYFPSYVLKAGERVIVYASDSYQLDPTRPFHGKFKLSSAGAHVYMYDPDMYLIDEMIIPTMTADNSYILAGVDSNGKHVYETTSYYSPGYTNTHEGFLNYRSANVTEGGTLVINEVCPDPKIGIPDQDGEIVDWLELRNNSNQPINLSNYYLSDKENKPLKWRFPENAYIPAGGYYLVYCSGKDLMQQNGIPHTNFSISAEMETLVLSDTYGRMIDRFSVENVPEDFSVGRTNSGEMVLFQLSTPGYSNDAIGQANADALFRAYNYTGVYITEVLASNDVIAVGEAARLTDYVELYNSSSQTVDLSGYGLSDSLKRPRRWQFPQGAVIEPGQYMVVYLDGTPEASTATEHHTNFSLTRNGGETISFCDPTGRVLDRLPLSLIPTDHSYGRTLGQNEFFYYDNPTPGQANGTGYYGYASTPSFSIPGGEYKGTIQVTIDVPAYMQVYYTMDGSAPTQENGSLYTQGTVFELSHVTVLRARAFDPSGRLQPSEIATQSYMMNLYHTFPVVSLVAEPDQLWNPVTGMLVPGGELNKVKIPFKKLDGSAPNYRDETIGKEPHEGHLEIYEKDGTQLVSQAVDFSLQGQYSLDMPQKSFKIRAKAKYGNKYFDAALFEDRPFTQYKSLVLRISGNDSAWTRLIDGFQDRLITAFNEQAEKPSTLIYQAWKPVVVYLNGVYWGHYNMRERVDRYFVAQHEGLTLEEADNMDILEASGRTVVWGSSKEYRDMIEKIEASSPGTNEEDLQYILDNVDVDNYFDYMAFEMFFGNSDPGNIRFYKLKQPGAKWRWIVYDLDYGLFSSGFNSPYSYLKPQGAGDQKINNTIIRKLLENDEMKIKFLSRLGEIYQFLTTEKMVEELDKMVAILEPEMPLHFARWAEETDKAITADNPTTPEGALRYWNSRIERLRINTLGKRPTYFYEMVQEKFELSDDQMLLFFGPKPPLPDNVTVTEGKRWS